MTQKRGKGSAKPNGSVATGEKKLVSKKRVREEDSEDEIEKDEVEPQRIKKIKQMLVDEDVSSDDEVDVEDSDEDDSDYEENSEEDSEHSGDTEDEFPEKVVQSKEAGASKKDKPQSPAKAVADEKPVGKKILGMNQAETSFKPSQSNIMLFNIPRLNEVELKGFLSKRNVHPESICCISGPVALLGFSSEAAAEKAMNTCSGANYDQSILAAVSASGEDLALIKSNRNPHPSKGDAPLTCVFVTDLPKTVSEKELIDAIAIEPQHVRLITSGRKNKITNACYIDCKSEIDAQKAFQSLSTQQFGGKTVKTFLKPQFNFNPITENSVVVANVPFSFDIDAMKKEFPEANKVELTRRGCFMLFFENPDVRDKVVQEAQGKTLEGRALRFITTDKVQHDVAVFVSNIAFTATINDLKATFPGCKSVIMKKNNGKFSGNAIVYFKSKEEAESAAKSAANKEINGRPLKVRMSEKETKAASEITKEDKGNVFKAVEGKKIKAVEEPVQVGSDSEEDEDNVEDDGDDDDDAEITDDSSAEENDYEEEADSDDSEEEHGPSEKKRPKTDENKMSDSTPSFRHRGGRGGKDFRGGNRGSGFRGGNRGGGFRGGSRGNGFRGGNRSRGREFRGGRGRGAFNN